MMGLPWLICCDEAWASCKVPAYILVCLLEERDDTRRLLCSLRLFRRRGPAPNDMVVVGLLAYIVISKQISLAVNYLSINHSVAVVMILGPTVGRAPPNVSEENNDLEDVQTASRNKLR